MKLEDHLGEIFMNINTKKKYILTFNEERDSFMLGVYFHVPNGGRWNFTNEKYWVCLSDNFWRLDV